MKYFYYIFVAFQISSILASCPDGSYEWQNGCYIFQTNATNFAMATSKCISEGGKLISIHDAFTNAFLTQQSEALFHESTVTDFWIGLTNLMPSQSWTWVDNTTFDFKEWASEEPRNIVEKSCAALFLTTGMWVTEECYKIKPFVCQIEKIDYQTTTSTSPTTYKPSSTSTVTPPTSTSSEISTSGTTTPRPPITPGPQIIPDPNCVSASLNMYLNYFIDTGGATPLFQLYSDIITQTAAETGVSNPTRLLSIYAANANGSNPSPIPFSDSNALVGELFTIMNCPWLTSQTSSVIDDLTYYQSVLNTKLTYSATPVIVMILKNPVDDVPASIAKMNAIKYTNPLTYFMGLLLSTEPTLFQLPFDYYINLTVSDNTAANTAVLNIINFACTLSAAQYL